MKTNNPKTINDHFDQKYGVVGSDSRKAFEDKAQAYMIAEMVKDARLKANLTQEELAEKLDVKRTYISKIERAVSDIRVSTLKKIIEKGLGGKLNISIDF